jgi:hypothetical protein
MELGRTEQITETRKNNKAVGLGRPACPPLVGPALEVGLRDEPDYGI